MRIALGVPTMKNFQGLAELFSSLWSNDYTPFVVDNWTYNNGVSKGWNEILSATQDYDLTIICNDDITFHDGSFNQLISAWENRPKDAAVVTGVSHDVDFGYHEAPDYSCFAFNSAWMKEHIGTFDENFTPAYFEDNDHHYRILISGHRAYCYSNARITHKGSQTQNSNPAKPVVTNQMFERNRAYYIEKWGGNPGKECYVHPYNDNSKDWKYCR